MAVNMDLSGIDGLLEDIKKVCSEDELNKTNKSILKKCGKLVQNKAGSKAPKSKNPWNSGRKGSRSGKHMADNIPISAVKNKNGQLYILVGWEKGDSSPYFYAKFIEYGWGTSKNKPQPFLQNSLKEESTEFYNIAKQEYSKLLADFS
ncbi:HK97 gp10 family phage protein [Clostridium sp. 19966]|uniref:HK97-gp10 family putative phage morphogenesis protein n=1 Tax=Clostridium sp. 19966 TaxID=2768166 RepID=UPI0028DDB576|nr:HK97-gp10 family putative phage morphogenesis protein [Clostridium sp. 19966]MDT8717606.1 HK97 gp10 family phage protein [Clostridium sp. 19966]